MKPLAIDLYCGLGGWAEGFLSEGYDVVGFDFEVHDYGTGGYPGQLVLQDVLTLNGSQFKDAAVIVASPPCQAYSYMAMPWTRAKKMAEEIRSDPAKIEKLNALFNACFRIQREACEAAGRHIPMVVENVRGAQKWVGRSAWHFGSYYLWGDVPALVPITMVRSTKLPAGNSTSPLCPERPISRLCDAYKTNPLNDAVKVPSECGRRTSPGNGVRFTTRDCGIEGINQGGEWWHDPSSMTRHFSSRSNSRKAASAMIAKIPFPLAQHIARTFNPNQ